ncbi:hypothetical protein [Aquimarina mytili]|uniref:Uncharacterized protein n=1 Tax=Aquimarina mytili TaxID=874423 RepID=A0A936ZX53_9FLAO|nr:hypothetical protein [Aquimarina mytili]MBL0685942.1 hypothetical protein [Aquimarina mytili]
MKQERVKKIISLLSISIGAIALISEISSKNKNYYIQSIGVVPLMIGLFLLNSKIESKKEIDIDKNVEEE